MYSGLNHGFAIFSDTKRLSTQAFFLILAHALENLFVLNSEFYPSGFV